MEVFMKVVGGFLVGLFVFLGSFVEAQETTSSSVDEQVVEQDNELEQIEELIEDLEDTLKPRDQLINELRAIRETHTAEENSLYKIEMYFDFRDSPYFTGREFSDRLFGAERNWEIWILRDDLGSNINRVEQYKRVFGPSFSIWDYIVTQFSFGRHAILGENAEKNGGSVKFHTIEQLSRVITIVLVERDGGNSDDFYFIDAFDTHYGKIELGEHSYFEISSVPVDR